MNVIAYQEETSAKDDVPPKVDTNQIHELLLSIGIPPNLYGYSYIVYSLELIMLDPEYMRHVTKGLYIDVARHFRATPSRIERAIRHAINRTWVYGDAEFIDHLFSNCIRADKSVPTNTAFLARLYYYLISSEN